MAGAVNLKDVRRINGRLFRRLDELSEQGWARMIAYYIPTDQSEEDYRWIAQIPSMREWIGGREPKGLAEGGIKLTNKTYEATLEINVDQRRRDPFGQIMRRVDELAQVATEHWHELLSTLIVSGDTGYDGKNLWAADHQYLNSPVQSNAITFAVVDAASPTPAEYANAIAAGLKQLYGIKNDQNRPMNQSARNFVVMVPVHHMVGAGQALGSQTLQGSGGPIDNPLRGFAGWNLKGEVNGAFSSSTQAFYIFRTDGPGRALIMQDELFETGTEDQSFSNNRFLWGVKASRTVGPAYWEYGCRVTLTTA